MFILVFILILATIFFGIWISIRRKNMNQLVTARVPLPSLGIQIICGDCAGDTEQPRKTFLDSFGRCSRCGGESYMLVANMRTNSMNLQLLPSRDPDTHPRRARVIAFGQRSNSGISRSKRVAV